jgi:hypothetical protein
LIEAGPQQMAEAVLRQAAKEGGRPPQPAYGPGRVERPTTRPRADAAVAIDDKVDQRLAGDSDHPRARARPVMAGLALVTTAGCAI